MNEVTQQTPIGLWQSRLTDAVVRESAIWKRVIVLERTDSTQDASRRLDAQIGDVITAGQQTGGRGRLGRVWLDGHAEGVAVTCVAPAARPERLAIASAVATADALALLIKSAGAAETRAAPVGIKWPNDVLVGGRKIAGVLIDQADGRAAIGVGVNVLQTAWPPELTGRAASLAEVGVHVDRMQVLEVLLMAIEFALRRSDDELCRAFAARDVLTGTSAGFRIGEREVRGKVLRVDPMQGLAVLTEHEGEVWLPAATTSVIKE